MSFFNKYNTVKNVSIYQGCPQKRYWYQPEHLKHRLTSSVSFTLLHLNNTGLFQSCLNINMVSNECEIKQFNTVFKQYIIKTKILDHISNHWKHVFPSMPQCLCGTNGMKVEVRLLKTCRKKKKDINILHFCQLGQSVNELVCIYPLTLTALHLLVSAVRGLVNLHKQSVLVVLDVSFRRLQHKLNPLLV